MLFVVFLLFLTFSNLRGFPLEEQYHNNSKNVQREKREICCSELEVVKVVHDCNPCDCHSLCNCHSSCNCHSLCNCHTHSESESDSDFSEDIVYSPVYVPVVPVVQVVPIVPVVPVPSII
ncbi:uncharacterized protein LOC127281299 [Leptopilina boulardi]|uniref:uncharacterized protein LOC127281299 n=1 Tax=Leptopilina boulardi TaxID=63433 RepID=UPI0021F52DC5|nr:uncharacterized protein LOC127281299 [Leptopilina boulardi]